MKLQRLTLQNFRNYAEQELQLSSEKNLFVGKNGQGKTNLLEAVYILSHSQSNRTHQERELMLQHSTNSLIKASIVEEGVQAGESYSDIRELEVQYYLEQPQNLLSNHLAVETPGRLKTRFKQNGVLLKSRSQFLGYLPSVSFFLTDLLLLRGVPDERRRWLDAAITQINPRHLQLVSQYQKVRLQKSKLLKEGLKTGALTPRNLIDHLEVWNLQLATFAAQLIHARLEYLSQIREQTTVHYAELSGGEAELSLQYQCAILEQAGQNWDIASLENACNELLIKRRDDEIRRATCLVGPHRDDILFSLGDLDAHRYGSQGQQRTVVLALKLSELWLLNKLKNQMPLLLLDDVMAELDLSRQQFLISRFDAQMQVLMTTTHVDQSWHRLFESREEQIFEVTSGSVTPYAARTVSI